MLVTFLLGLILHFDTVTSSYECISRCSCMRQDSKLIADCSSNNLTQVPVPQAYQVNVLLLDFNRITYLRKGSFLTFTLLTELNLTGNRLRFIEEGAFDGLDRFGLQRLDLSHNNLRTIPPSNLDLISSTLTFLSLSFNGFNKIPKTLSKMQQLNVLDISQNTLITSLPTEAFPVSLETLNLAYTSIRRFKKFWFLNATNLRRLILRDNLASVSVVFDAEAFDGMSQLEYLDLSRTYCRSLSRDSFNKLTNLSTLILRSTYINFVPRFFNYSSYFLDQDNSESSGNEKINDTLEELRLNQSTQGHWFNPKLRNLDLSHNRKVVVPISVQGFSLFPPSLVMLDLSYTIVPSISPSTFSGLSSLKILNLCHSRITKVTDKSFSHLENLASVYLSQNYFLKFPNFPLSVSKIDLSNSKVSSLTINDTKNCRNLLELDLGDAAVESIEPEAFYNMSCLQKVVLTGNSLKLIEARTFVIGTGQNSSLKFLDLSYNTIRAINGAAFVSHGNLNELYLQNNNINLIDDLTLSGLKSLKKLNLANNRLTDIAPTAMNDLSSLNEINLQNNQIDVIYENLFTHSPNLKRVALFNNKLLFVHPQNFPSLISINLKNNKLTTFPQLTAPMMMNLDLSRNDIQELNENTLTGISKLRSLNLNFNSIGRNINYSAFKVTPDLKELNLANCHLPNFVEFIMPSLQVLILQNNKIEKIFSLSRFLPSIQILDLSFNNIATINPSVFNNCQSLISVDLLGNNFACDCNLLPLADWLNYQNKHQMVDVVGLDSYVCESPMEFYLELILQVMENVKCNTPAPASTSSMDVALILLLILFLIIVFVFILYCYCRKCAPRRDGTSPEHQLCHSCSNVSGCLQGIHSRVRVSSQDEGQDLMFSSPPQSPKNNEDPILL